MANFVATLLSICFDNEEFRLLFRGVSNHEVEFSQHPRRTLTLHVSYTHSSHKQHKQNIFLELLLTLQILLNELPKN